ncbi:MAG: pilus assembly protein TadG-related protein [Planctomycetota bacterium]
MMQTAKSIWGNGRHGRRAAVIVQVAVMTTVIIGFGALAIDLGTLYMARSELQRAADAAALAGASCYFTDAQLIDDDDEMTGVALQRAQEISFVNTTLGAGSYLELDDVIVGTYDFVNGGDLDTSGMDPFNAVKVTVRRTAGSFNGPVGYGFARIFGREVGDVIAEATAVTDDRFAGYSVPEENGALLPFTIRADLYEDMLLNGPDEWMYEDGQVIEYGDNVREIKIFPIMQKDNSRGQGRGGGEGEDEGGGNFGLLNIGANNQGVPFVEHQILNGVSADEMEDEIGTPVVEFYNEFGEAVVHEITGNPGVKAGIEDAVEARIGDVVGFFIHDDVWDNGANAVYRIVDIRFGRLMYVQLNGCPDDKRIVLQPVAYTGPDVIIREYADSTDGQIARMWLAE